MPIEFTVVGEHRHDASQFLVIDAHGQYYQYDPVHEQLRPVDIDDQWDLGKRCEVPATADVPTE